MGSNNCRTFLDLQTLPDRMERRTSVWWIVCVLIVSTIAFDSELLEKYGNFQQPANWRTLQIPRAAANVTEHTFVTISDGGVMGVVESNTRIFRSIPYAEGPVGNLRWKPPVPVSAWKPT